MLNNVFNVKFIIIYSNHCTSLSLSLSLSLYCNNRLFVSVVYVCIYVCVVRYSLDDVTPM